MRAALDAGVPFIGLVASTKRGTALLDEMGLTADERARVHCPVGLWIGARTATEIAVSVLAEIIKAQRLDGIAPGPTDPLIAAAEGAADASPAQAIDPVCGMTVTIGPETVHLEVGGEDFWFCCPGCRDRYAAERAAAPAADTADPAGADPGDRPILAMVEQAIDPVCGMTVTIGPDTPHAVVGGEDFWFCCPGCKKRYVAEHADA
ncbi:MAG: XdhC family protein [Nocardioides sp.]